VPVRGTSAAIARATPCPERAKSDRGGLFECKETIEARLPSNDNDHSSNSDLQAAGDERIRRLFDSFRHLRHP